MYLNNKMAPIFYFLAVVRIPFFPGIFYEKKRSYIISGKGQQPGPKQHNPDSAERPLEADLLRPSRVTMSM